MQPNNEPKLMQLYLRHCAIGFALSAVFVGLVLWQDVGGLGGLVGRSQSGAVAVFLLWFFNGTVFGSVQFAIMIMRQAEDRDDDDDQRGRMIPARAAHRSSAGTLR